MGLISILKDRALGSLRSPIALYADSAAIVETRGTVRLTKAGVAAMTLAAPGLHLDGTRLRIYSNTAQAHTVTQASPGFNGLGGSGDVATFGGAIGDNILLEAYNGIWWVLDTRNVSYA